MKGLSCLLILVFAVQISYGHHSGGTYLIVTHGLKGDNLPANERVLDLADALLIAGNHVVISARDASIDFAYEERLMNMGAQVHIASDSVATIELVLQNDFRAAFVYLWFWYNTSLPQSHINTIRQFSPKTAIVILTDDVPSLRQTRMIEAIERMPNKYAWRESDPKLFNQGYIKLQSEIETEVFKAADVVITVTDEDREAIQPNLFKTPVLTLHFNSNLTGFPIPSIESLSSPQERQGVTFVGFGSNPTNRIGLAWFFNSVFPLLSSKLQGSITFQLVGEPHPSYEQLYASGADIQVYGALTARETKDLLSQSRVSIVPVIATTGINTKIVLALQSGVPIVSTSLGAMGLQFSDQENFLIENAIAIANAADTFASALESIYTNDTLFNYYLKGGNELAISRKLSSQFDADVNEILEHVAKSDFRKIAPESEHFWTVDDLTQFESTHIPTTFMTLTGTGTETCSLGDMDGINFNWMGAKPGMYASQDIELYNGQFAGSVYAGGNVYVGSYSTVGSAFAETDHVIVSPGLVHIDRSTYIGLALYGTDGITNQISTSKRQEYADEFLFDEANWYFAQWSTGLGAEPNDVNLTWGTWTGGSVGPVNNISSGRKTYITSFDCGGANAARLQDIIDLSAFSDDHFLIFNVAGTELCQPYVTEGMAADHILWNFFEAREVDFSQLTILGSILAPFARVSNEGGGGSIDGTIVSRNIAVDDTNTYYTGFSGCLPDVLLPVPSESPSPTPPVMFAEEILYDAIYDEEPTDYLGVSGCPAAKYYICHIPTCSGCIANSRCIGQSVWPTHRDNHHDFFGGCDAARTLAVSLGIDLEEAIRAQAVNAGVRLFRSSRVGVLEYTASQCVNDVIDSLAEATGISTDRFKDVECFFKDQKSHAKFKLVPEQVPQYRSDFKGREPLVDDVLLDLEQQINNPTSYLKTRTKLGVEMEELQCVENCRTQKSAVSKDSSAANTTTYAAIVVVGIILFSGFGWYFYFYRSKRAPEVKITPVFTELPESTSDFSFDDIRHSSEQFSGSGTQPGALVHKSSCRQLNSVESKEWIITPWQLQRSMRVKQEQPKLKIPESSPSLHRA